MDLKRAWKEGAEASMSGRRKILAVVPHFIRVAYISSPSDPLPVFDLSLLTNKSGEREQS